MPPTPETAHAPHASAIARLAFPHGYVTLPTGTGAVLHQELYRSDNLVVRRVGFRGGTVIITFGSYTNVPDLDRAGFGEEFLRRGRIDAIHVINRYNRWYQHPDTREAVAAVAAAARRYDRAITYGSSMGGYAALRYATPCRADTVIAVSPQHTVDPRLCPWETRWQPDVANTAFEELPYVPAPTQYVFYDPRVKLDSRHVDAIERAGRTIRIPVPYAGHPVGALLVETGALQSAIRAIVAGDFDPRDVMAQVRRERRVSQHRYYVLARRASKRRPALAEKLLAAAAAIEPESHILSAQAVLLDRLGRSEEAAPLHRAAIRRTPHNSLAWMGYAGHLEKTGDRAQAAQALRSAVPGQSGSMLLRIRTMQLRMWLRRHHLSAIDRLFGRIIGWIERSPYQAAILRRVGLRLR